MDLESGYATLSFCKLNGDCTNNLALRPIPLLAVAKPESLSLVWSLIVPKAERR